MAKILDEFPRTGLVRESSILAPTGPIPISRSTWWQGVREGRFPQPVRTLGPRTTAWRAEDIRALFEDQSAPTTGNADSAEGTK